MSFTINKIPASKNLKYFLITFSIYFVFQFLTASIADHINPDLTKASHKFDSLSSEFIMVIIVAPIVETIIFQYLIIETCLNLKLPALFCMILSALLFGASHFYNPVYAAVLTVVGFILAYYYMSLRHQGNINKIVLVIALHALANMIAFFEKNFLI